MQNDYQKINLTSSQFAPKLRSWLLDLTKSVKSVKDKMNDCAALDSLLAFRYSNQNGCLFAA